MGIVSNLFIKQADEKISARSPMEISPQGKDAMQKIYALDKNTFKSPNYNNYSDNLKILKILYPSSTKTAQPSNDEKVEGQNDPNFTYKRVKEIVHTLAELGQVK